jgi:hypothetical protein
MASDAAALPAPEFKDRKSALIGNGSVEVLAGVFLLGSLFLGRDAPTHEMTLTAVLFGALGALFIAGGVGSMSCRRWGRSLSLVVCWLWLFAGAHIALFTCLFFWQRPRAKGSITEMDAGFAFSMIVLNAMFDVVIPAALVLFYSSKHVKVTVEMRDPRPCWTDRCPTPVLVVSAIFTFGACFHALAQIGAWAESFQSVKSGPDAIWSQTRGALEFLAWTVFLLYAAWGTYRLRMRAWWSAVIVLSASVISSEAVRLLSPRESGWFGRIFELDTIAILVYLLYLRRFFKHVEIQSHKAANEGSKVVG